MLGISLKENPLVRWSSRWDYLLESMPHANIQWFRCEIFHYNYYYYYYYSRLTAFFPGQPG